MTLYGILFLISALFLPGLISLGFILFLALMICKIFRIIIVIYIYNNCRKRGYSTRIKIDYFKRNKIWTITFLILFSLPIVVFILGLTPMSISWIEIDINKDNGNNKGEQEIQLSFYATLSSYDYLTDENVLKALNGTDFGDGNLNPVEILLLVRESSLKNANESRNLAYIVRNCTKSGLNVWIWFVYLEENGYYPSFEDYEYLPEFKSLFDDWVSNFSLDIYGILFDNEFDQDITGSWGSDNFFTFLKKILQHRREARKEWINAASMFEDIADEWSDQGYNIALVGSDFTLFDMIDNDADIQQLFGIVNNPPDMWDRVSFMLYRECEFEGMGQDMVYLLAGLHKKLYGKRAVVALGCMNYGPYKTIDGILQDIALLKFQGYNTIELFEFGAFYAEFGYDGLIEILESTLEGWNYPKFRIIFTTKEFFLRSFLLFSDILLDFF
ncbi:MAG: hypothetical protein ACTSPD_17190 [Promethearchaeota archaeon]